MIDKITFISIKGDSKDFTYEESLNILRNPSIKTWDLPKDSPYKFVNNDLVRRQNKKAGGKKAEKESDRISDTSSGEA